MNAESKRVQYSMQIIEVFLRKFFFVRNDERAIMTSNQHLVCLSVWLAQLVKAPTITACMQVHSFIRVRPCGRSEVQVQLSGKAAKIQAVVLSRSVIE